MEIKPKYYVYQYIYTIHEWQYRSTYIYTGQGEIDFINY